MITPLTPLPLPPTRQDPVNFAARADAFLAALPDFQIELNTLASELDSIGINATQSEINAAQSATDAQDAAIAAGSFANYKGLWSSLTGALNKPASVKHNGKYWNLLNNLANVQSSEPGVSADWEESDIVRVSGADFTGPVTVPSGATGSQVPRSSEVVPLAGGVTMTGPLSVPAGATGSQVPQAQGIPDLVRAMAVGTVSQSGGVPTGAVIERGSNASGQFVRFADGTQICWNIESATIVTDTPAGALYRSASNFSVTFPAAFADASSLSVLAQFIRTAGTNSHFASITIPSATGFSGFALSGVNNSEGRIMYVAIGRWF